jgi:hypothetical protein
MDGGRTSAFFFRVSVLVALLFEGVACSKPENVDYTNIVKIVDAYRANPHDVVRARALEDVPCQTQPGCKVKAACLKSAKPMKSAMEKKARVKTILAGNPSDGDRDEGLRLLDEAKRLVTEAEQALEACDTETQSFRRLVNH